VSVAWYRFGSELRGALRSVLVTALVFGIAGGIALTALSGARRTASAFPRLLDETRTGDVTVNPDLGTFSALEYEAILGLPGVESGTFIGGAGLVTAGPDGGPDLENFDLQVFVVDGGLDRDRLLIAEGRMPAREAPDEMLLSPSVSSDLGLDVGDTVSMYAADFELLQACEAQPDDCADPFEPVEVTVVGIGRMTDEIAEPSMEEGRAVLSPAFLDAHPNALFYWGGLFHLAPGASVGEFRSAVADLAPEEPIAFETTSGVVDRFQSAVRPQAVALALFGAVVGAAALLFVGLALVRQAAGFGADRAALLAMGTRRRSFAMLGGLHGAVAAAVGAVVAVVVAIALSPLTPQGPARDAEPDPGVFVDPSVFLGAIGVSVVLLLVTGVVATLRLLHRPRSMRQARPSIAASALSGIGAPPPLVVGARLAFERGAGTAGAPIVATLMTVAVAAAGALAATTFVASLGHLLGTPSEFGSNWDVSLDFVPEGAEVSNADDLADYEAEVDTIVDRAADELLARDDVAGLSVLAFGEVDIDGRSVPTLGIDVRAGAVHPTLAAGRPPQAADEVVLGAVTMERAGVGVGDRVRVGGERYEVTGSGVFPGYARYPGQDPTDLGEGAWVTLDGLAAAGIPFTGRTGLVAVADGVDARAAFVDFRAPGMAEDEPVQFGVDRPSTVANLDRVRTTPIALALTLGVLGAIATAHALVLSIRRRRPDLAVLRAVGFERRQVVATVAWQATCIALAASVIGVPLGVMLGRWSWQAFIEELGGVSPAIVPGSIAALVVVITLVASNLVALVPGWRAARMVPAAALRTE
jgi:hypothetical protein